MLLVPVSVRSVHVLLYAVVAALVPFSIVTILILDVGGLDGRALVFAGLIAAPAGVAAAISRHPMRWFERGA